MLKKMSKEKSLKGVGYTEETKKPKEKDEIIKTLFEFKKKFRRSKEWREKREQLIKDRGGKCELCGGAEHLTPAHQDYLDDFCFKYEDERIVIMGERVDFYIRNSSLMPTYKDELEKYDCLLENKETHKTYRKLRAAAEKKLIEKFIAWYKNLDICLLLCRKCHYAQHKGMVLCKCKKKYYDPELYSCCYNCNPEKDLIEAKTKIREIQDEIDDLGYDYDVCCEYCGKDWDGVGDWSEDDIGNVVFCPKCRKLPNLKELMKRKNEKIEKRKKDLEEQQRRLIRQLEAGDPCMGYADGYATSSEKNLDEEYIDSMKLLPEENEYTEKELEQLKELKMLKNKNGNRKNPKKILL